MRSDDDEPSAEDGGQLTLGFGVRAFDGGCALCQPWGFERARTRRVFRKGAGRTPLRIACDTNIIVEIVGSGSSLLEPFDHRELIAELSIRTSRKDRAPLHMRAIGLLLVFWSFRDVRFYAFPSQMRDAQEAIRGEADAASRARAIAALATILLEETEREHLSESCGACGRAPVRRVPRRDLSEDDLWLLGSGIRVRAAECRWMPGEWPTPPSMPPTSY